MSQVHIHPVTDHTLHLPKRRMSYEMIVVYVLLALAFAAWLPFTIIVDGAIFRGG